MEKILTNKISDKLHNLLTDMPDFVFTTDKMYENVFNVFYDIRESVIKQLTSNKILNDSHINLLFNSLNEYIDLVLENVTPIEGNTLYVYLFTYLRELLQICVETEYYENAQNIKRILDKI